MTLTHTHDVLCNDALLREEEGRDMLASSLEFIEHEIALIGCKIAIYRNRHTYNAQAWETIIHAFTRLLRTPNNTDALHALIDAITTLNNSEDTGIYCKMDVNITDGSCGEECGSSCRCITRDEGICVCSVMGCKGCSDFEEDESDSLEIA